jgi:(1->4)-alpha-D-glucan 1-alpha-D-glucosylmutase
MTVPSDPDHIPIATYRLQLRSDGFTFDDAAALVPYLDALGVGDAYLSPLFRAGERSTHGYDVVDHGTIEPAFGGEEGLARLADRLHAHNMGLLLDVVPNHMGVDDPANRWWQDVLAHGEGSRYAGYFDIGWNPPIEAMRHKVLLPVLGDYFGRVLERQELNLQYDGGRFWVTYYQRRFPVAPATWPPILRQMVVKLDMAFDDAVRMELESLITALDRLPPPSDRSPERMRERYRESEVAARRLRELVYYSHPVRTALDAAVAEYNGTAGEPRSFDLLEALLDAQAYRLAFWRVAGDEINYRRFFDINELAAIRVEEPAVFEAVHALTFRLLAEGKVNGLRIDHPDGLFDPPTYFENLQAGYLKSIEDRRKEADGRLEGQEVSDATESDRAHRLEIAEGTLRREPTHGNCGRLYVVAEKILAHDEQLDPEWPVCGTTGYEFLNRVNGLFIAEGGAEAIRGVYERFIGQHIPFRDVLYGGKRTILNFSMSSELHMLAWMLTRIAGRRRESRDFTYGTVRQALREVVASFPVYRTYVRPGDQDVRDEDRRRVKSAIRLARRFNPELPKAVFDFLSSILLLEDPNDISDEHRAERRRFVLKLQQVTGPVMAKGLEDTAFYRYYPLASLNEVGGEPNADGLSPEILHRDFARRRAEEPYAMSASTTHDTKRGEDIRARLNVLSEIPDEWEQAIGRWRYMNAAHKTDMEGTSVPDPNEAYLIYQTLVGTWPHGGPAEPFRPDAEYVERIVRYCEKAFREAKLHTSWLDPDADYENAIFGFVRSVLDPEKSAEFLSDVASFVARIADAGYLNGLAQLLIKVAAPGIPDFYQGTELWDFRLVDPDNRGPVNFGTRKEQLSQIAEQAEKDSAGLVNELLDAWPDERIKLFLTWRALNLRKTKPDLFLRGDYLPLEVGGERARHVFAFARREQQSWLLVVVPRLTLGAARLSPGRIDPAWWADTAIVMPQETPATLSCAFTGRRATFQRAIKLSEVLTSFPVGLLHNS